MAFPRKLLNDSEELVVDIRPHWIFLMPSISLLVLAIAFGVAILIAGPDEGTEATVLRVLAGVLVLVALIFFVVRWAKWACTIFVLTSDRVVTRRGVFAKSGVEIPLEKINTVLFNQRVLERMVGAGDLTIESAGERGADQFTDIRKPAVIQREIYVQMEDNNTRMYAGRGGSAGMSVAEQIEKLHGLRQQGLLTAQEFEVEKAKLLSA